MIFQLGGYDVVKQIAAEYKLPLWDYEQVAKTLPGHGFSRLARCRNFGLVLMAVAAPAGHCPAERVAITANYPDSTRWPQLVVQYR